MGEQFIAVHCQRCFSLLGKSNIKFSSIEEPLFTVDAINPKSSGHALMLNQEDGQGVENNLQSRYVFDRLCALN